VGTAVDASVVIAWQNPSHVFHSAATQMLAGAKPPLHMCELNTAEVLVGLAREAWPAFLSMLVEAGFVFCAPDALALAQARLDSRLRMPDAHVIATARTQAADTILSLDKTLISAATSLGFTTNVL